MYISNYEFFQYVTAAEYLQELKRAHHIEIQRLYDDIHPTRIAYDSGLGAMFSESVNVEDYAIWMIETKEKQKKQRSYYEEKADVFKKALFSLTNEERLYFETIKQRGEIEISNDPVIEKLKRFLETQIEVQGA